jgi:hypothetical protein
LDIEWLLLPNTLRSKDTFFLLFIGFGCRQRPTEDTLFNLNLILSELSKTATADSPRLVDSRPTAEDCGDSVE